MRRPKGAIGILRELHKLFDFDQPFDPCPHGGGAKPCCCGFADPTNVNAAFAEAYVFLNRERKRHNSGTPEGKSGADTRT